MPITREGTTMARTSAPEIPAWLDLDKVIPAEVLDKVIPTQVLEAMREFVEEVQPSSARLPISDRPGPNSTSSTSATSTRHSVPCLTKLATDSEN
jgi:hypothetical protein